MAYADRVEVVAEPLMIAGMSGLTKAKAESWVTGSWTPDEQAFEGYFPACAVLPSTTLIAHLAEVSYSGMVTAEELKGGGDAAQFEDTVPFMHRAAVSWSGVALPGDAIDSRVAIGQRGDVVAAARVGGKTICRATLGISSVPTRRLVRDAEHVHRERNDEVQIVHSGHLREPGEVLAQRPPVLYLDGVSERERDQQKIGFWRPQQEILVKQAGLLLVPEVAVLEHAIQAGMYDIMRENPGMVPVLQDATFGWAARAERDSVLQTIAEHGRVNRYGGVKVYSTTRDQGGRLAGGGQIKFKLVPVEEYKRSHEPQS